MSSWNPVKLLNDIKAEIKNNDSTAGYKEAIKAYEQLVIVLLTSSDVELFDKLDALPFYQIQKKTIDGKLKQSFTRIEMKENTDDIWGAGHTAKATIRDAITNAEKQGWIFINGVWRK